MSWILLALYVVGSLALDVYLLKHPPLFKKGKSPAQATSRDFTPRVLGIFGVVLFSLLWCLRPVTKREDVTQILALVGFLWRLLAITPWTFLIVRWLVMPVLKKKKELGPLTFIEIFWRIGSVFQGLFLALLWGSTPLFSAAWRGTPIPVALLLIDMSMGLSLLIFLGVLFWSKLFPPNKLFFWAILDVGFLAAALVGISLAGTSVFWRDISSYLTHVFSPAVEVRPATFLPGRPLAFLMFVLTAPTLTAALLMWWAPQLIPVTVKESDLRRQALNLLLGFFTGNPKPSAIIGKGKVRPCIAGSLDGAGPGWLLTEPENVVVLKSPSDIRRIVGPGAAFTHKDESVHSILDLRPHLRTASIPAITRDGIKVDVKLTLVFQIDPGRRLLHPAYPWPYARDAAWRIVLFAAEVNPDGHTPQEAHLSQPWSNLPLAVAQNVLPQIVIAHTLDELYGASSGSDTQRQRIGARLQRRLTRQLAPLGIRLETCAIELITPVEAEVTRQRIEAWKARWIAQLMVWRGEAQARRFANFAAIHNQALLDLVHRVTQPTSTIPQQVDGGIEGNLLALNLLENLERIAREPEIQTFLPESAIPVLTNLQERLKDTTS